MTLDDFERLLWPAFGVMAKGREAELWPSGTKRKRSTTSSTTLSDAANDWKRLAVIPTTGERCVAPKQAAEDTYLSPIYFQEPWQFAILIRDAVDHRPQSIPIGAERVDVGLGSHK